MKISNIKLSELATLGDANKSTLTNHFKNSTEQEITRKNNRITGITPDSADQFLHSIGVTGYRRGGVLITGNLCGGVGKTSSTWALSAAIRRITSIKTPIIVIDTDSQASFTTSVIGEPANDDEPILLDVLDGKASLEDIVTDIGNNMWFIKSNLNQVYADKSLSKPSDIKRRMLDLYQNIFETFGDQTKIFQDHTPQLSSIFASSVCALCQLPEKYIRSVLIPMRSDKYAINGAEKILDEIYELQETFSLPKNIDIHCFFSSIDKRISTTQHAITLAKEKQKVFNHLSPIAIRYCAEIPKSIQGSKNLFESGKKNKATEDYQDLMQSVFCLAKDKKES